MPSITRTCRGHERHQKERRDAITQNGLSFLRIVDEGAINCKRGAPLLIVYISTVSAIQHGFDAAQRVGSNEVNRRSCSRTRIRLLFCRCAGASD